MKQNLVRDRWVETATNQTTDHLADVATRRFGTVLEIIPADSSPKEDNKDQTRTPRTSLMQPS